MKAIFGDTMDADAHWNVVQNNGMLASNLERYGRDRTILLIVLYRRQSSTGGAPCPFPYRSQTTT